MFDQSKSGGNIFDDGNQPGANPVGDYLLETEGGKEEDPPGGMPDDRLNQMPGTIDGDEQDAS